MISRGIIIGKVVDDFASLAYQLNTRNKLGQFDLTNICEDFIKEVLNITFDYNLKNLNSTPPDTARMILALPRRFYRVVLDNKQEQPKKPLHQTKAEWLLHSLKII